MSTKYESADLILKLYDMRREATMRKARDWFFTFNPQSVEDIRATIMSEQGAYFRMVTSYWDMAASLVTNGAIDEQMFEEANGEHWFVFMKVQPFLAGMREASGVPTYLKNLEQVVTSQPNHAERLEKIRERVRAMAETRAAQQA